jgi:lipoate-protein ligase B
MLLRHLHLPSLTRYTHAGALQNTLTSHLLAHKASPTTVPTTPPTIITAQFHPVYTCGRREVGNVTTAQKHHLTRTGAEFHEALRGGQTTFHGPGQLIAYPILDLKRHGLSAKCFVNLLESAVMHTCARYGVETRRTENPGVWVDEDRKVCAVGVHLRRNVSSHGIGLNVSTDLGWLDRIVGCGLEDKRATSLEAVLGRRVEGGVEEVAKVFVEEVAKELKGVDGVEDIREEDVR